VLARTNNENNNNYDLKVYLPIENVKTEKNIYALTVNLDGGEHNNDVMLLSQVLRGLKAKVTFFVSPEWLEENTKLYKKIKEDGHNFGLSIKNNKTFMSREDAIEFLASQNDNFLNATNTFPNYVRIEIDKSGKIPKLLNSFGQKYISSSNVFATTDLILNPGDIVCIKDINSETPYNIAEFIGKNSNISFQTISLDELLNVQDEIIQE
jgi:peptidoglycan/xylan/chitin deacetylase (PgdA/CDA1 family)